jgi:hypothetical protein
METSSHSWRKEVPQCKKIELHFGAFLLLVKAELENIFW